MILMDPRNDGGRLRGTELLSQEVGYSFVSVWSYALPTKILNLWPVHRIVLPGFLFILSNNS